MTDVVQTVAVFDIDGVLLELADEENDVYTRAFAECLGIDVVETDWNHYDARTDIGVAEEILSEHSGDTWSEGELEQVLATYVRSMRALVDGGFVPRLLDGVVAVLECLSRQSDVGLVLASGNLAEVARIRLKAAGLWQLFDLGAFAEDGRDKSTIPRTAYERSKAWWSDSLLPQHAVYLGDQPSDLEAANFVGMSFVGIGNHASRLLRLQDAGVDSALASYPAPREFRALLDALWAAR